MLPRFAKLEAEFDKAVQRIIRRKARQEGIIRDIKSHVIHEGKSSAIQRATGDYDPTEMKEARVETQLSFQEIENINLDVVVEKAAEISEQFARHFSKTLFETMDEATKRTGQTFDGRGQKLTNEMILSMLEMMPIEFERDKERGDLSIVTSPAMESTFRRLAEELESDPVMKKKFDDLFERKRNEFREREINRNLAG